MNEMTKLAFLNLKDLILEDHKEFGYSSPTWILLTALRGPDRSNFVAMEKSISAEEVKEATTAVIRTCVFGPTALAGAIFNWDSEERAELRRELLKVAFKTPMGLYSFADHFLDHAYRAFKVLDLKWDEYNVPPSEKSDEQARSTE